MTISECKDEKLVAELKSQMTTCNPRCYYGNYIGIGFIVKSYVKKLLTKIYAFFVII